MTDKIFDPRKASVVSLGKMMLQNFQFVFNDDIPHQPLWIYTDEDGFINLDLRGIRLKFYRLFDRLLPDYKVREIYKYLVESATEKEEADRKYIRFKNGILDTETKQFFPPSADLFIKNLIPWSYKPNAEPVEIVDKVLDEWSCGDEETRQLILEWAGYCLFRGTPIPAFMLIMGCGLNGKGTYCDLLASMVGIENLSALFMKDLDQKFSADAFFDKALNISDVSMGPQPKDSPTLRAVSNGDYITVKPKRKTPFLYRCTTKMTFYSDRDIVISDKSDDWKSSLHVLLFEASFLDQEKRDVFLIEKLKQPEAMEYFIKLAMEAAIKAVERGQFTLPKQSKEWIEKHDKK